MITSTIFGVLAVLVGALLLPKARWKAAGLFLALLVSVAATGLSALGSPMPLSLAQYLLPPEIIVAGYQFREGVAIDIMVGGDSPMLVSLPWSEPKAAELQQAGEEAKARHARLRASIKGLLGKMDKFQAADGEPIAFPEAPPPGEAKTGD